MEQFVLGIFQEHLSQFIVGFRKERVNANLLNGKGEITDVSLNCDFLNENLAKVTPFVELESVHISKLSFHVTAWSNLKHAPIVIDIQDVQATIVEPMGYLGRDKRRVPQQLSREQLTLLIQQGLHKLRGAYNIFDRILDNLRIEIRSVLISFQPRGKFKTRRTGPWTPPTIVIKLRHVKYVSVDEYGEEASPEQVWHHNRHAHGVPAHERTLLIYKKLSLLATVGLRDPLRPEEEEPPPLLKEAQVEVHLAFQKRMRDAGILAVQIDATMTKVDIRVDPDAVPMIAHAMAGIKYCTSKDRPFDDPLVPMSAKQDEPVEMNSENETDDNGEMENEEGSQGDDDDDDDDVIADDVSDTSSESDGGTSQEDTKAEPPSRQASSFGSRNQPVILLPNGLVIHERISVSLSVHQCTIRGFYAEKDDGYVQLVVKGFITEVMWPKVSREKGGYAQASLSFVSLQEKHGRRIRQILSGGMQHDINKLPLALPGKPRPQKNADENFPLFEERSLRPDPFGLRHTFPAQAFGIKMTVSYVDKVSNPYEDDVFVLHEIGVSQVNVLVDSEAWCRALRFAVNDDGNGFDPRWHSGDWSGLLTTDMLVNSSQLLDLSDHLQPTKELFLDENLMISSDLMNVTARIMDVEIRVPAAIRKDVRSCDIVLGVSETMLVVSSALPRTFLSGKIGSSIHGDGEKKKGQIDFPNDESDLCYSLEESEDPAIRQGGTMTGRAVSTVRFQLTVRGFSARIIPVIPFCNAIEPQQLVEPIEMTMIVCFEGEPPESPESNLIKIVLFISVQIHRLSINCDFDVIAGALSTLIHHAGVIQETAEVAENPRKPMLSEDSATPDSPTVSASEHDGIARMSKTLKNRRVLVRRQIARSRETGGLSASICMQMAEFSFQLWRQNVPLTSSFRASLSSDSAVRVDDTPIALMKLLLFEMNGLEVGAEWSVQLSTRRVVLKCCLSEMKMAACDFEAERRNRAKKNRDRIHDSDDETAPSTDPELFCNDGCSLVELLAFGPHAHAHRSYAEVASGHSDILLRAEEQLDSARSLSLACEVGPPGVAYIRVREIEALCLLLFEALLMPTGMRANPFNLNGHCKGGLRFPDRSVGALFSWLIYTCMGERDEWTLGSPEQDRPPPTRTDDIPVSELDELVHSIIENILPERLHTLVARVTVVDVLVFVPHTPQTIYTIDKSKWLGLVVHQTTLLAGFFSPEQRTGGTDDVDVMNVLASGGKAWSSFFDKPESGLHVQLRTRPSLYAASRRDSMCVTTDSLVSEFEVMCSYHPSDFALSMGDSALLVKNLDDLNHLYSSLLEMKLQSRRALSTIIIVLDGLSGSSPFEIRDQISERNEERRSLPDSGILESFAETELSMHGMRRSLSMLKEVSEVRSVQLRDTLHRQQAEIDALRYEVFSKERARIAALALISSQLTGWLRMSGTHTYGQRVSGVTRMWRYYLVLRRSLLLVLSDPGEPKPIDIIQLEGSQLRPLAGGRRKRDVQRGFSIIESGGVVRFFVAENGPDYEKWILAITRAIQTSKGDGASQVSGEKSDDPNMQYAQEHDDLGREVPDGIVVSENNGREALGAMSSDLDETDLGNSMSTPKKGVQLRQRLSAVKASTKSKLGVAVQAARQRGFGATGDDHNVPDFIPGVEDEIASPSTFVADMEARTETDSSTIPSEVQETDSAGADEAMNQPRRMGGRFAAIKAGTKNRLGSALQAAKEKSKAAVDQRRRQQQQHNVTNESEPVEPARTGQPFNMTEHDDSGIPASKSFESDDVLGESSHSDGNASFDVMTSARTTRRSQLKDRLGAAVKSVRLGAMQDSMSRADDDNAGRFNLRRRFGNSAKLEGNGSDAIKLRGIYVGRGSPVDELGVSDVADIDDQLQKIEGYWVVKVVACAIASDTVAPSESKSRLEESQPLSTMDECEQEEGHSVNQDNGAEAQVLQDEASAPLEGSTVNQDDAAEVQVQPDEAFAPLDAGSQPALSEDHIHLERGFRISVLSNKDESAGAERHRQQVTEVVRSLSDVLALHTTLSECVGRIAASAGNRLFNSANDVDGMLGSQSAPHVDMSPLDIVRLSGKLLNGLLEAGPTEFEHASTSYSDYQGEVLKEFLNSVLECPLPPDGLEAISRFLDKPGILNLPSVHGARGTSLAAAASDDADPTIATASAFTQEILACTTSCENDLLRAETQARHVKSLIETGLTRDAAHMTTKPDFESAATTTQTMHPFLEPLLPSKIIENLHDAMHGALMNVMAERDESHAQLIASSVLNMHEMEQERKKIERLNQQLHVMRTFAHSTQSSARGSFLMDKNQTESEEQMRQNSEKELVALCEQLASEISEKTSASLEIIRLKESRNIERENERAEEEALQNELKRCKELLAAEEKKAKEAKQEALAWKRSYEESAKE